MRTEGRRESTNVEDRRRMSPKAVGIGGGLIGLLIVLAITLLGGNPQQAAKVMEQLDVGQPQQQAADVQLSPEEEEAARFVRVVLADTEDVWTALFREQGAEYTKPTLVLFTGQVQSACGFASAATGPFYCPLDRNVYLDLSFFEEMKRKFNAPGDFAQAYVVAHEIGHHVQNLLGISEQVQAQRRRLSEVEYNRLSVRLELQADYLAGVWAHHAQEKWQVLEPGDIREAIDAATAIGDDRLQRQAQGYVVPESFTHGTSEQRVRWFYKGLQSGDMLGGNTFEAEQL
ncbi:putative neutral zinc metallopeptidase [Posidoniimonas corsicana]|uniref:Putative neutral zinc metallopeptidase n=1 Tax=Posidoniimonas corsicana TaxID=1938618 RepID=A0A5C5VGP8_9BACT|nr:neutral zinc metallopeptidase [Posidoniimonas corsicana]TWT37127.1 putative neutral zinc metallopeptidase [Posidoniimonas corsicana]